MKKEIRMFEFEVRAEMDESHGHFLTGRPVVYGQRANIGPFDEIIEPGALSATDLQDVRFLVNHNVNMIPLARSRNNNENSTMQLMPDDDGMAIRVDLDVENNVDARSLYSAVGRGDISGMSFMMIVDDGGDTWDDARSRHPVRHIRSIKRVLEVSAVTFPAYVQTSIQTRGLSDVLESIPESLESERSRLEEIERQKEKTKTMLEVLKYENH